MTAGMAVANCTSVPHTASLRDVLSELLWRGAEAANVFGPEGQPLGQVTLATILARGRAAS